MKRRYSDLFSVAGVLVAYSVTIRLAMHSSPVESLIGGAKIRGQEGRRPLSTHKGTFADVPLKNRITGRARPSIR